MPDNIIIKEVNEDDIEAVLSIDKKIVGDDRAITYRDPITFYLGGESGVSFLALEDGKPIGFALGRLRDPENGWLQAVAIDPDYRRRDLGTKLVQALINGMRSKGVKNIHTIVSWRDWGMLSFLNSLGFTRGEMVDLQKTLYALLPFNFY